MRKRLATCTFSFGSALCLSLLGAMPTMAGPAEEANAALDRFSAAYTANDVEALVGLYAPNAILLGTNSPTISEGREAVRTYFTGLTSELQT
jgi:ketosteroid isomerase-like protein